MANGRDSIDINALLDYYSQPEPAPMTPVSPAQPYTGFVPASGAPADMVYDVEVGDFVSPQKAAARDAIRAQRANLAMDRAVYGTAPGYTSLMMREEKGPFAYMGDMPPMARPADTYGQPMTPQTLGERALEGVQAGAERAMYSSMGAITGGLVGEGTVRNIIGAYDIVKEDEAPYSTASSYLEDPPPVVLALTPRGVAFDLVGELAHMGMQESTSVPAAYVKEQVGKLQGGGYIPDFSELAPKERPAAYSNALSLLNFGLPKGYFGSDRHKKEEALSKRFGEPLTNEVKIARDMMKLTAKMQDQDIVKAGQPSLVDQFKDFGYTIIEAEAAAALAALL